MDELRYVIALLLVLVFPAGMSMWFVIHPFAGFWRRRTPVVTYSVVLLVAGAIAVPLFRSRGILLEIEFGFNWILTLIGFGCLALGVVLKWMYRQQIMVSTLLGLPEVSASRESELLTEGIYSRIRHPRYASLMLGISAFALYVNYLAAYGVVLTMVPILYLTVRLEERELLQRFGDDYERYAEKVPRFIPRGGLWRRTG